MTQDKKGTNERDHIFPCKESIHDHGNLLKVAYETILEMSFQKEQHLWHSRVEF